MKAKKERKKLQRSVVLTFERGADVNAYVVARELRKLGLSARVAVDEDSGTVRVSR